MENEILSTVETSEETQDVADPVEETVEENLSEERQEVADPVEVSAEENNSRTAQDSAFAELRRSNSDLQRRNEQLEEALGLFFNDSEDLVAQAHAYSRGVSVDEVEEEFRQAEELEEATAENEQLRNEILNLRAEQLMRDGLREIQSIDPTVKSLEELGGNFAKYIESGLSSTQAYYAVQAERQTNKINKPSAIGRVNSETVERDYFTSEEVDRMSSEEIDKNWDKVMRSMKKW